MQSRTEDAGGSAACIADPPRSYMTTRPPGSELSAFLRHFWLSPPVAAATPVKRWLRLCVCAAVLFLYAGCEQLTGPTSPAGVTPTAQNTAAWSPCAVVHNPGGAPFNTQMDAVSKLQRAGKLQWMRLDTHLDGSGSEYHRAARQMGLRTMSIACSTRSLRRSIDLVQGCSASARRIACGV